MKWPKVVEFGWPSGFPKPTASAQRALAKYISVVESMVFDALQRGQTPEQRKLGVWAAEQFDRIPTEPFDMGFDSPL